MCRHHYDETGCTRFIVLSFFYVTSGVSEIISVEVHTDFGNCRVHVVSRSSVKEESGGMKARYLQTRTGIQKRARSIAQLFKVASVLTSIFTL